MFWVAAGPHTTNVVYFIALRYLTYAHAVDSAMNPFLIVSTVSWVAPSLSQVPIICQLV
jgi:hypothetical protein